MFSGWSVPPYSKEIKLGSSNEEASPSTVKNARVVLVQCCTCCNVCPYSYFEQCGYSRGLWVPIVMVDELSVRVTKITSRVSVS